MTQNSSSRPILPVILIKLKIWILSVLLFIFLPIFPILCLPIYIFRALVSTLSRFTRPDLGKIVSSNSTFYANGIYKKPQQVAVMNLLLEGPLDLEKVRHDFYDRAICRLGSDGQLKYPELQQYISTWLGFYFWKWDTDFQIQNHVREYEGKVKFANLDQHSLHDVLNEILLKPFPRCRSPWEILLFPKYRCDSDETPDVPKTLGIFRWQHVLADGISFLNLIVRDVGEVELNLPAPNYAQKTLGRRIMDLLTFSFRLPYDVSSIYLKSSDPFHQFHVRAHALSGVGNMATSQKIPLSYIKEIRNFTQASLAGIIMAAFTGALRTLMLEEAGEVPECISIMTPMPVPDHPDKLRNHATVFMLSLPVGMDDPERRLRKIEANLKALKNSTFPDFAFWFPKAVGLLLSSMTKCMNNGVGPTAVMSIVPGPTKQVDLFERRIMDWTAYVLPLPGIALMSMSYNGNIKLVMSIDESILPNLDNNMTDFMDNMLRELDKLKMLKTV